jgi:hypothetical protein
MNSSIKEVAGCDKLDIECGSVHFINVVTRISGGIGEALRSMYVLLKNVSRDQ